MDPLDTAGNAAKDILTILGDNHISTLVFGAPVIGNFVEGKTKIPLFTVLQTFDAKAAIGISEFSKKWAEHGIEGPYIMELNDIEGMSDSIPEELLDVTMNYQVLEGMDVIKTMPKLNQEHLRAQAELAIRRYIYNLRWKLTQVIGDGQQMEAYLNNLAFYSQLSIRVYHRLTLPWVKSTEDHLEKFIEVFPQSHDDLKELLNHVYKGEPLGSDAVELSTSTLNTVLQPILSKIDEMGR